MIIIFKAQTHLSNLPTSFFSSIIIIISTHSNQISSSQQFHQQIHQIKSKMALNLNSLYTPPVSQRTSTTTTILFSSSNSSFFTNTFKPLNLLHTRRSVPISSKKRGLSCNCMFGLGVPELAVIAGVATLVFGPKALPEIGRNFGKTIKSFQQVRFHFFQLKL